MLILRNRSLAFAGIMLGMLSSVMMQTIIATVLPVVANDIGQREYYGWIFSAYMIASIITIPLFSGLSESYGRKPFYLGGMILFLLGSLLGGFSQSMVQLIIFRIVQGIGAGAVAPSAIAMISELFDSDKRVKMLGLLSFLQVLASLIGPLLGGFITDFYHWRWAFFINIPIGMIAFSLIFHYYFDLPKSDTRIAKQVDYFGSVVLGLFLVLLITVFQTEDTFLTGFNRYIILILAILTFIIFVNHEKRHPNSILSFDLVRKTDVKHALIGMFFLGVISYGMITILPLYVQNFITVNALAGGELLLAFSLGIGMGGIFSSRISRLLGLTRIISISWLITLIGLILFILMDIFSLSLYIQFASVIFTGLGIGINLPLYLAISQNSVAEDKRAIVGGIVQISRNVGGALGVPLFTNIILFQIINLPMLNSFNHVFSFMAILALIGFFISLGQEKQGGERRWINGL